MANTTRNPGSQPLDIARHVQRACIEAALRGYKDAAMSGLCDEGAFEAAISAMQMLDLEELVSVHNGKD